jgi:hypothetical protein
MSRTTNVMRFGFINSVNSGLGLTQSHSRNSTARSATTAFSGGSSETGMYANSPALPA